MINPEVKNKISHKGQAIKELAEYLHANHERL